MSGRTRTTGGPPARAQWHAMRYADAVTAATCEVLELEAENELLAELDAQDGETLQRERLFATLDAPGLPRH